MGWCKKGDLKGYEKNFVGNVKEAVEQEEKLSHEVETVRKPVCLVARVSCWWRM